MSHSCHMSLRPAYSFLLCFVRSIGYIVNPGISSSSNSKRSPLSGKFDKVLSPGAAHGTGALRSLHTVIGPEAERELIIRCIFQSAAATAIVHSKLSSGDMYVRVLEL
jgi:hypothetical protein